VVFVRYAVHLAFMVAVWGWRDPGSLWRTRRPAFQLARSAMMVVMPASFVLALRHGVPVRTVLAVFAVTPLLLLALARALLGERARWPTWAAAAVAAAAAAAALEPGRLPSPWLALLPLAMAASFSVYVVMTRSLRTDGTRANLFYTAAGVAAVLALDMPRVWVTPTPHDLAILVAIGLAGWTALWAIDRLAAGAPVSVAAPASALYAAFAVAGAGLAGRGLPAPPAAAALVLLAAACAFAWARPAEALLEPTP
jgi:drug/metabolite transporter (DMT)-like permease